MLEESNIGDFLACALDLNFRRSCISSAEDWFQGVESTFRKCRIIFVNTQWGNPEEACTLDNLEMVCPPTWMIDEAVPRWTLTIRSVRRFLMT